MALTDKQSAFLENLFGPARGNAAEAVRLAGYAEGTAVSAVVGSQEVQEEIAKRTKDLITTSTIKAYFKLEDLLDKPTALGAKETIAVAKDLLDRGGFAKTDKFEVKTENPLFILPAKEVEDDV